MSAADWASLRDSVIMSHMSEQSEVALAILNMAEGSSPTMQDINIRLEMQQYLAGTGWDYKAPHQVMDLHLLELFCFEESQLSKSSKGTKGGEF